jgi:holo-[acyl-carrier protein] synthase
MIHGIGIDIVEIDRIQAAVERLGDRFLKRVFHPGEIDYSFGYGDPYPRLSARFACKEAVAKSLGVGMFELGTANIQVVHREAGPPEIALHNRAEEIRRRQGVDRILISLSHGDRYAVAQALAMRPETDSTP